MTQDKQEHILKILTSLNPRQSLNAALLCQALSNAKGGSDE